MKKYRKKPVVIEAVQITDATFDDPRPNPEHISGISYDPRLRIAFIATLSGVVRAKVGDWILRGVKSELYPCKPDIFQATYEAVDEGKEKP